MAIFVLVPNFCNNLVLHIETNKHTNKQENKQRNNQCDFNLKQEDCVFYWVDSIELIQLNRVDSIET